MRSKITNFSQYRYHWIAQTLKPQSVCSKIQLRDLTTQEMIEKSPWEIICSLEIISQLNPENFPLLCAAAVEDRVKEELMLKVILKNVANQA